MKVTKETITSLHQTHRHLKVTLTSTSNRQPGPNLAHLTQLLFSSLFSSSSTLSLLFLMNYRNRLVFSVDMGSYICIKVDIKGPLFPRRNPWSVLTNDCLSASSMQQSKKHAGFYASVSGNHSSSKGDSTLTDHTFQRYFIIFLSLMSDRRLMTFLSYFVLPETTYYIKNTFY